MTHPFDPEELLSPAPTWMRRVVAGLCLALALAFAALSVWALHAMVSRGSATIPAFLMVLVFAAISLLSGAAAFGLGQSHDRRTGHSRSRGLYVASAFFGILALLLAGVAVLMNDFSHVDAILGALIFAVLSFGAARNVDR